MAASASAYEKTFANSTTCGARLHTRTLRSPDTVVYKIADCQYADSRGLSEPECSSVAVNVLSASKTANTRSVGEI